MSHPTVLHPDVVEFLRQNTRNQFREQVWKCLQKLKQGQFDGGLRVKKLKGTTKGVWEARITEASRIIFTYQHSLQPEKDLRQTYIAVQDICIDHDDVSRSAEKARKRTADAEWLDTDVIKEIAGNFP
ncbi:MAG: hypothetical protein V7L14_20035 [Nostoc sp.]|uniref:hypothetical protein n=1 Tax=Nostoc sp. TaxID=1180 RepID=UPI002FFC5669